MASKVLRWEACNQVLDAGGFMEAAGSLKLHSGGRTVEWRQVECQLDHKRVLTVPPDSSRRY